MGGGGGWAGIGGSRGSKENARGKWRKRKEKSISGGACTEYSVVQMCL